VQLPPDETDVTVSLAKDALRLETQVVTGLATTISSRNSANAVTVIDSSVVNRVPVPTIENALQGKIPGAVVSENNGGAPGGGLQVQMRGVTSIEMNAAPLYVVDGVIVDNETIGSDIDALTGANDNAAARDAQDNSANRIADLNPNDIESIEVLKGSSASAIYGSKAAAGVIVITTKKGAPGKAKWDVTQKLGTFETSRTLNLRTFPTLGSAQAWFANTVKGGADTGSALAADNALIASVYGGPQDYQNQLFSAGGFAYETDVSVRGATENNATNYYVSGLTKYDPGVMTNTGYNKQSARANVTQNFSSAISATANLFYTHALTRRGVSGNDNIGISPYDAFAFTPQFINLNHENADGSWAVNPFSPANPFQDARDIQTPEITNRFIGGGNISWTPLTTETQSLKFTFVGGADYASQNDRLYAPPNLQVEQTQAFPGVAVSNNANLSYLNGSANLIHHYTGFSFVDATTSIGIERDKRSLANPYTVGQGLPPGYNTYSVGEVQTPFDTNAVQKDLSWYAQEQLLLLDQRLALTGGVAGERSTSDGDINKFFYYPKFSVSYRIPQFVGFLNEFKLRGAYGQSGTLPTYGLKFTGLVTELNSGINGVYLSTIRGDPTAVPEVNTEFETGFDAAMFGSRMSFSGTVYQKRVTNTLLLVFTAPSLGYNRQWQNGGQFTNQGIELSLGATPIQSSHGLNWTTNISYFRNYSVVNNLPTGVAPFDPTGQFGGQFGSYRIQPGRSLTQIVNSGLILPNGQPQQVGDGSPTFVSSFSNTFTWGPVQLEGLLDWHYGGSVSNLTIAYYDNGLYLFGDSAQSATRLKQAGAGLTPYVLPGGFLKLREVTLSYDLPNHFVSEIGFGHLTSLRASLTGRNLFISTKDLGLDPEISNFGSQNVQRGQEVTPYPPVRSFFFTLDLGL